MQKTMDGIKIRGVNAPSFFVQYTYHLLLAWYGGLTIIGLIVWKFINPNAAASVFVFMVLSGFVIIGLCIGSWPKK
jgi:peptidoglycan/LPS O-acetylase OafA/YrhL